MKRTVERHEVERGATVLSRGDWGTLEGPRKLERKALLGESPVSEAIMADMAQRMADADAEHAERVREALAASSAQRKRELAARLVPQERRSEPIRSFGNWLSKGRR